MRTVFRRLTISFALFFWLVALLMQAPREVEAQWSTDPDSNTVISAAAHDQQHPAIVSDGAGGAIIIWMDSRSGTNFDIYAQRMNAAGVVQWALNGVAISVAVNNQFFPAAVSDGAGGAIITWYDGRNGTDNDIYAQRITTNGVVQWTANGVAICTATGDQENAGITSDGIGGAIIAWQDFRSGTDRDIYAQRINAAGAVQWTVNGVAVCTAMYDQYNSVLTSDGTGGAIMTWLDGRHLPMDDIYAQRINVAGVVQWASNGVSIAAAVGHPPSQIPPGIISDNAGGAIIAWNDFRSGTNYDIYTQSVNAVGAVQWTTNGIPVCTAAYNQYYPALINDGSGGAIISWHDGRGGDPTYDVYAQRVSSTGVVQWSTNGVAISTAAYNQEYPVLVSDGAGGAIIAWGDTRSGGDADIYAQRIDTNGVVQWTAGGIAISTALGSQQHTLVSDGLGGAIITWADYRALNYDIYAQRVGRNGNIGTGVHTERQAPATFNLQQNYPNPFNPSTTIRYALPHSSFVMLAVYNTLGQRVAQLVNAQQQAGYHDVVFRGEGLASGVYFYRLDAGSYTSVKKLLLLK